MTDAQLTQELRLMVRDYEGDGYITPELSRLLLDWLDRAAVRTNRVVEKAEQ